MSTAIKAPPITVDQFEGFKGFPGLRALRNALAGQPYVAKQNSNIKFPLANSMPAPDAFVVEREVWKRACAGNEYISVSPALVVEVVSPSNQSAYVRQKIRLYLDHGVRAVWEVLPDKQSVRVHRLEAPQRMELSDKDAIALPAPLSGELPVSGLFRMDL